MRYVYPEYACTWSPEVLAECRAAGQKLLEEVGYNVPNDAFVDGVKDKDGIRFDDGRLKISRALSDRYIEDYVARQRKALESAQPPDPNRPWTVRGGGFSISVIDIETDEAREATTQDLKDLIKLIHSLGIQGNYPCVPQDVPHMMRPIHCFKVCHEESAVIRYFEYMDAHCAPYIYEMSRVVDQPFWFVINCPGFLTLSKEDVGVFMDFYPKFRKHPEHFAFYSVADYPMLGVSKPITSSGCVAYYFAAGLGAHILFTQFDPRAKIPWGLNAGVPVDLQNMCWAYASPRTHLYDHLNRTLVPALCGVDLGDTVIQSGALRSSSCAVDERAGMEKMASALLPALRGARDFTGAGNLAVDDLFSGAQLVIDCEIVDYVKEYVECFNPHADIFTTEGMAEVLTDVVSGKNLFYSHTDTARKIRNLLPVSRRRPHEKLRAWMTHKKGIKDIAREECLERIKAQEPYECPQDTRTELDKVYRRAEQDLA